MTPLQRETAVIVEALYGARERLTEQEYLAFVSIVQERLAKELARLAYGEALRLTGSGER